MGTSGIVRYHHAAVEGSDSHGEHGIVFRFFQEVDDSEILLKPWCRSPDSNLAKGKEAGKNSVGRCCPCPPEIINSNSL